MSDTAQLRMTSSRPTSTCTVLHVEGEVDLLTTPSLSEEVDTLLTGGGSASVVLDLSGVTFFGSSGLAMLIKAAETASEGELRLILVAANRAVLRPLEVTTTAALFTIYATVEAALAAV